MASRAVADASPIILVDGTTLPRPGLKVSRDSLRLWCHVVRQTLRRGRRADRAGGAQQTRQSATATWLVGNGQRSLLAVRTGAVRADAGRLLRASRLSLRRCSGSRGRRAPDAVAVAVLVKADSRRRLRAGARRAGWHDGRRHPM